MNTLINVSLNIFFILLWNMIIFLTCININVSKFDPQRQMFKEKSFEKSGIFDIKNLKIKKWKDYLPQYTSKNGFSKKNFISKEIKYINRFIYETCRAEWNHRMCLLVIIPIAIFNNFFAILILSAFSPFLPTLSPPFDLLAHTSIGPTL